MRKDSGLGRLIWTTSRADEGTISITGADIIADAIIAAGWTPPAQTPKRKMLADIVSKTTVCAGRGAVLNPDEVVDAILKALIGFTEAEVMDRRPGDPYPHQGQAAFSWLIGVRDG
jgi:hypothetical protein